MGGGHGAAGSSGSGQGPSAGASNDAGSDDGGSSGSRDRLIDPVAKSQGDATLAGSDADSNGVRDDVDDYILSLENDGRKVIALTAFSRELTQMMVLGANTAPTRAAAYAEQVRIVQTIDCLASLYASATRRTMITNLSDALLNNAFRLGAYHAADALLSGTILPRPGVGCDPSVTRLSR